MATPWTSRYHCVLPHRTTVTTIRLFISRILQFQIEALYPPNLPKIFNRTRLNVKRTCAPGVALGTGRIPPSQRIRHVTKQAQGLALRPHLLSQERNRYFRIRASDPVIQGEGEVEGGGEWKLILKLIFHLLLFFPKQKSTLPPPLPNTHTMVHKHPSRGFGRVVELSSPTLGKGLEGRSGH